MKKLALFVFVGVLLVVSGGRVAAQTKVEKLETVLEELLVKYEVSTIQELDCDKLTEEEFERVGAAWLTTIHTDRIRMYRMMGGEDSQALEAAEIRMGENYLGCNTFGMMGGMMGIRSWDDVQTREAFRAINSPQIQEAIVNLSRVAAPWVAVIIVVGLLAILIPSILTVVLLIVAIKYFLSKGGGKK